MSDSLAPLFEDLTGRQRDQALNQFDEVLVRHGTPLIVEGDEDASVIVVVEGELDIRTGDLDLWTARSGEIVGEIALFTQGIRTASVETNTEARLLILTRDGYDELVERNNPVAARLENQALQTLVARLRRIDRRIAEAADGTPVAHVTPSTGFFNRVSALFGMGGQRRAPEIDRAGALQRSPLFQDVDPDVVAEAAQAFTVECWAGGHFLITEGEAGSVMYVVVDGAVDVVIETRDDKVEPVASLEAGDALGMAGLVDNRPRTASCVCRGDTTVLALDRSHWMHVQSRSDEAGRALRVAMIRSLADSLSYANAQLSLLDLTAQAVDLRPLLMASAGVEASPRGFGG